MLSKHGGHVVFLSSLKRKHTTKLGRKLNTTDYYNVFEETGIQKWTTNHHLYKWGIQVVVGIQKDHIEVAQRLDQLDLPLSLKGRVVALDLVLGTNTKGKGFLHCFIVGTYAPWNPLQSIKLLA